MKNAALSAYPPQEGAKLLPHGNYAGIMLKSSRTLEGGTARAVRRETPKALSHAFVLLLLKDIHGALATPKTHLGAQR